MDPLAIRRTARDAARSVSRPQSVRRAARGAGQRQVVVRPALRRRRGLGDRRAAQGQDLQLRSRPPHRYRAMGQGDRHRSHARRGCRGSKARPSSWRRSPRRPPPRSCLPPPPPPAVEVLFSAPTEGETDVRLDTRIRVQLSRDLDESSLKGHVRITYSASDSADRGEPQPPAIEFTTSYAKENRALEIRPVGPWERFRRVKVEFLEGVKGTDGGALAPFTLTFTTGGSSLTRNDSETVADRFGAGLRRAGQLDHVFALPPAAPESLRRRPASWCPRRARSSSP